MYNKFKIFLYTFISLVLLLAQSHAYGMFYEGKHYRTLAEPIPTYTQKNQVEVLEFFWYGCIHCYKLDKLLSAWFKKQNNRVSLKLVPAIIQPEWVAHAQAYYSSFFNKSLDKTHIEIFEAIHDRSVPLNDKGALADFIAVKTDGDPIQIGEQMESLITKSRILDDIKLQKNVGLRGVPSIVVNGKYVTNGKYAGSFDRLIAIVDFLVKKELKLIKQNATEE